MVVRDEEEITRLTEVFNGILSRVPEMVPLLESLRRYCMNERTFNEEDFKTVITRALMSAPYMTRLKLNLPFQVVGRASSTATLLLATTLACIAHRPRENEEGHWKRLETLVIDHLSDTALSNICSNHLDASNTVVAFMGLKNLVLSIKRQEDRASRQTLFTKQLWFLITKAVNLESLCLVGWNARRNKITRRHRHGVPLNGRSPSENTGFWLICTQNGTCVHYLISKTSITSLWRTYDTSNVCIFQALTSSVV